MLKGGGVVKPVLIKEIRSPDVAAAVEYQLIVEGAFKDGHPIQLLGFNLAEVSRMFDQWVKTYPFNTVTLEAKNTYILKQTQGIKKPNPTKCPKGHEGLIDKKSVVKENTKGGFFCVICGAIWGEEVKE